MYLSLAPSCRGRQPKLNGSRLAAFAIVRVEHSSRSDCGKLITVSFEPPGWRIGIPIWGVAV